MSCRNEVMSYELIELERGRIIVEEHISKGSS